MKPIYNTLFVVYLFCFIQISPALQYENNLNYEDSLMENRDPNEDYPVNNQISNSGELNEYETDKRSAELNMPLSRSKRFFGPLISLAGGIALTAASTIFGKEIGRFINRAFGRSAAFMTKEAAIDQAINHDYNAAVQFKNAVAKIDPEAARAIVINKNGITCDEDFCSQNGNGLHSLGICTPQICLCSYGNARQQVCKLGLVFDPINKMCNNARFVTICGA